jgi:hypothetical protein
MLGGFDSARSETEDRMDEESKFERRGPFMARDGLAKTSGGVACQKKLCLVATDKAFLIRLLVELSERPDCFFVKYSVEAKDGMYLGRAFLTDEPLVGDLWLLYKDHPKLMCSIQDDDYTKPIRDRRSTA